jgi:RNA polymerase primary sigma factor
VISEQVALEQEPAAVFAASNMAYMLGRYFLPAEILNEAIDPGEDPVVFYIRANNLVEVRGKERLVHLHESRFVINALALVGSEGPIRSSHLRQMAPPALVRKLVGYEHDEATMFNLKAGISAMSCRQISRRPDDYELSLAGVRFEDERPKQPDLEWGRVIAANFRQALGLTAPVPIERIVVRQNNAPDQVSEPHGQPPAPIFDLTADMQRSYAKKAGETPLLSPEEEVGLGVRVQAGLVAQERLLEDRLSASQRLELQKVVDDGRQARNDFAAANLRLVMSIAASLQGRGMAFEDLVQDGNVHLLGIVEKFDPLLGYKFSTYATLALTRELKREIINKARLIRLPEHVVKGDVQSMGRALADLTRELQSTPSMLQLSKRLGIDQEKAAKILHLMRNPISTDSPKSQGDDHNDGRTLGETIEDKSLNARQPEKAMIQQEAQGRLREVLGELDEFEQQILIMEFGLFGEEPLGRKIISQLTGRQMVHIRKARDSAFAKLRSSGGASVLAQYFGGGQA